jgi:hypothetical protein
MPDAEFAKKHPRGSNGLLFSPGGKRLITADVQGNVFVWQRDTGLLVTENTSQRAGDPSKLSDASRT